MGVFSLESLVLFCSGKFSSVVFPGAESSVLLFNEMPSAFFYKPSVPFIAGGVFCKRYEPLFVFTNVMLSIISLKLLLCSCVAFFSLAVCLIISLFGRLPCHFLGV